MDGMAGERSMTGRVAESGLFDRLAKSLLFRSLSGIRDGSLRIFDGEGIRTFGQGGDLSATVTVHSPGFYRDAAFGGSVGAGASYMDGAWTCDDLVSVVRILVRNAEALSGLEGGAATLSRPFLRLYHALRRNTEKGSRRNIRDHYDLGNDFYELFLDPSMAYSCGIFERSDSTLEEASRAKFDRACRKLDLRPGDHLLEIGCGWGGLAIHAARHYGCRVTGVTISESQFEYAQRRVRDDGLSDRVTILLEDYRRIGGAFDKLVSVEMIEAVGHQYLDGFFQKCASLLKPDGAMLLQAITVPDRFYRRHLKTVDFIKRYIFPGSFIPSVSALSGASSRTELRPVHLEDITPHYARTLREWRSRFHARIADVRALGFPDRFVRMWEYYLCYCEGSFAERFNGNVQVLFAMPSWRGTAPLPHLAGSSPVAPAFS
ncbi:MAG TPA: cyclopropane-fatty-acyl-phospholipid synthase family protein [Candidatus Deferrimicrobiaceae bacterium]